MGAQPLILGLLRSHIQWNGFWHQALLGMRTFALYERSKRIAFLLATIYLIMAVVAGVSMHGVQCDFCFLR